MQALEQRCDIITGDEHILYAQQVDKALTDLFVLGFDFESCLEVKELIQNFLVITQDIHCRCTEGNTGEFGPRVAIVTVNTSTTDNTNGPGRPKYPIPEQRKLYYFIDHLVVRGIIKMDNSTTCS